MHEKSAKKLKNTINIQKNKKLAVFYKKIEYFIKKQ